MDLPSDGSESLTLRKGYLYSFVNLKVQIYLFGSKDFWLAGVAAEQTRARTVVGAYNRL